MTIEDFQSPLNPARPSEPAHLASSTIPDASAPVHLLPSEVQSFGQVSRHDVGLMSIEDHKTPLNPSQHPHLPSSNPPDTSVPDRLEPSMPQSFGQVPGGYDDLMTIEDHRSPLDPARPSHQTFKALPRAPSSQVLPETTCSPLQQSATKSHKNPSTPKKPTLSHPPHRSTSQAKKQGKEKIDYSQDDDANEILTKAYHCYMSKEKEWYLPNKKKKSVRTVAAFYNVPKSTLQDRISGRFSVTQPPQQGRKSIFTEKKLRDIVDHLLRMAEIGYGYSPLQAMSLLRFLAANYKNKENFCASRKFLVNLYYKFPELSTRKVLAYDYQRAKAVTPEILSRFFEILESSYKLTHDLSGNLITARHVWSLDEVGFKLNSQKDCFVIARRGIKNAYTLTSSNSAHVSVIFCTNANGYVLPPYFIVKTGAKEEFIEDARRAGFGDSPVFATKNAFVTFPAFSDFTEFFIRETKFNSNSYSVLLLDGHKAHTFNPLSGDRTNIDAPLNLFSTLNCWEFLKIRTIF